MQLIYSYNTSVHLYFILAKGLRSHSLYNYAEYILPCINIVYRPRNIPVHL